MAGIGEWNVLTDDQLKAAFDEARGNGKDFLVKISYTSTNGLRIEDPSLWMRMPIFMMETNEATGGVRIDNFLEDLRAIYNKYGSMNVERVYRLDCSFEEAVSDTKNPLPLSFAKVERQFALEAAQAEWEGLPWYKKLYTARPVVEAEPS